MLPEVVRLRCLAQGRALAGAWIVATLPMRRKNDYHSWHGPADDEGAVIVTREQLLSEAKRTASLFVMDYVDVETNCLGMVEVHVANRDDVARLLSAIELFGPEWHRPGTAEAARRWADTLDLHDGKSLTVVNLDGGDGVVTVERRA